MIDVCRNDGAGRMETIPGEFAMRRLTAPALVPAASLDPMQAPRAVVGLEP